MARNKIIPYNPALRQLARKLRNNATLGEVLLWRQLRARQLKCGFHRQVPIGEYIVDFYCHELRLAIEVDGSSHNAETAPDRDAQRQRDLERLGVTVMRFQEREVRQQLPGVVDAISDCVARHAQKDIPPTPF